MVCESLNQQTAKLYLHMYASDDIKITLDHLVELATELKEKNKMLELMYFLLCSVIVKEDGSVIRFKVVVKSVSGEDYVIECVEDIDSLFHFAKTIPFTKSIRYTPVPKFGTELGTNTGIKLDKPLRNSEGKRLKVPDAGLEPNHCPNVRLIQMAGPVPLQVNIILLGLGKNNGTEKVPKYQNWLNNDQLEYFYDHIFLPAFEVVKRLTSSCAMPISYNLAKNNATLDKGKMILVQETTLSGNVLCALFKELCTIAAQEHIKDEYREFIFMTRCQDTKHFLHEKQLSLENDNLLKV